MSTRTAVLVSATHNISRCSRAASAGLLVALLSVCAAVVSCGLLKKKGTGDAADAAPDVVAVTEVVDAEALPVQVPKAANEDDIARFPDEVPVEVPSVLDMVRVAVKVPTVS